MGPKCKIKVQKGFQLSSLGLLSGTLFHSFKHKDKSCNLSPLLIYGTGDKKITFCGSVPPLTIGTTSPGYPTDLLVPPVPYEGGFGVPEVGPSSLQQDGVFNSSLTVAVHILISVLLSKRLAYNGICNAYSLHV